MLPVVAVVLAAAALLVALVALVSVVITAAGPGPGDDPGGGWSAPLSGQVAGVGPSLSLSGPVLAGQVSTVFEDDGGEVQEMTCPDTPTIGQGVTTVCHGQIDYDDWAVVVFFEDRDGRFTLLPL